MVLKLHGVKWLGEKHLTRFPVGGYDKKKKRMKNKYFSGLQMMSSWLKPLNFSDKQHLTWLTHSLTETHFLASVALPFSVLPSNADVLLDSIFDSCCIPSLTHMFNYPLNASDYQIPTSSPLSIRPLQSAVSFAFPPGCPLAPSHHLLPKPVPPPIVPTLTCPSGKRSHPRT